MNICFFVEGYPTPKDPYMPFVKNTIAEIACQGDNCFVISPQSVTRAIQHGIPLRPKMWIDHVGNTQINVYQPFYLSFSGKMDAINRQNFITAASKAYRRLNPNTIDVLYGHFWHMGIVASKIDKTKPLFIACGESKISVCDAYSRKCIDQMKMQLAGVVYVSTKSYKESVRLELQDSDIPYTILPNGFNPAAFYCKNKRQAREKIGWPQEGKVVIFVGSFTERKGVLRLSKALSEINKVEKVYSCFIGSGSLKPTCPNILFCGKVDNKSISDYLNASDVFVLPTTNEGCCNAIIEAMACGLPIISSEEEFNDDILNEDNSIRIDSMNVEQIEDAIHTIIAENKLREEKGKAAQMLSKTLTISERIQRLRKFMRECV